ncbi:MAG: DM13 domain-containing protein [Pseudomonadota bacterium]
MRLFKSAAIAIAMIAAPAAAITASADTLTTIAATAELPSGDFVRKNKTLRGSYTVIERDGSTFIQFSDDFRASNGPDLKIFLSPNSIDTATGNNATDGSILLGELVKTRGVQEYEVPAGVNLADFGSVLVHCEAFSVLWGGSDL